MKDKIIKLISENKLSSADVADALGGKGVVEGVVPVTRGFYCVGEVEYLFAWAGSNWYTHRYLATVSGGKILFIDNFKCGNLAIVGHLMSHYAIFHKKVIGIVVNGNVRDIGKMSSMPIWAKGYNPIVCSKQEVYICEAEVENIRIKYQGGILTCDDTGCVIITPDQITESTLSCLTIIAQREQDWYEKMNDGLSTFEITCL